LFQGEPAPCPLNNRLREQVIKVVVTKIVLTARDRLCALGSAAPVHLPQRHRRRSLGRPPGRLLGTKWLLDGLAPGLDLALAPPPHDRDLLGVCVDGVAQATKGADEGHGVGLINGTRYRDELDQLLGIARGLLAADGGKVGVLVRLVQLKVAGGLSSRPAQNYGDVVDERRLGQLAQRVLVVGDVDHGQQDAQVVLALQVADARVDVLGVEAVVLEAAREAVSCWVCSGLSLAGGRVCCTGVLP